MSPRERRRPAAMALPVPPRLVRRLLAPLLLAGEAGLLVVVAAVTALATLAAPVTPRRRVLRVAAFAAAYLSTEIAVLVAAFAWWVASPPRWFGRGPAGAREDHHYRLLTWGLARIMGAAGRTVGFRVVVEDRDRGATLAGAHPMLVVARHGGPGDSFALAHLLLAEGRRPRIVLKRVLQLDPALDVVLHRVPTYFLPAAPAAVRAAGMAQLAATMDGPDALLIFPEGGNWTPRRWARVVRHLHAEGRPAAAAAAQAMPHVLPPRLAGMLACLRRRPDLEVAVVAHTGLDREVTVAAAWAALPLVTPMTVRWWRHPPGRAPADEDRLRQWLTGEWAVVDAWIDARRARAGKDQRSAMR